MLNNILRWMRITNSSPDDQQFPAQQLEYLGKAADATMLFPYGYHGNVPPDFLVLGASVQNNPDNRVVLGVLPKIRPKLKESELAFYHPKTGSYIKWDEAGNLYISNNEATLNMVGDTLTLTGNLVVKGTMTNNGKDVGDTHQHSQSADSAGNSQANIVGVL